MMPDTEKGPGMNRDNTGSAAGTQEEKHVLSAEGGTEEKHVPPAEGGTEEKHVLSAEDTIEEIQEQVLKAEEAEQASEEIGSIGHINQDAVVQQSLKLPVILIGSVIYAFGINVFLKPMHIYSGGFMGICQLIQTLLQDYAHVLPADKDITGILYWILNAPALAYAWKKMRRRFFYKSIFSVTAITIVMGLIPIPAKPILEDYLGNAIIAGLVCGTGIGVILRMGAADGGLDLVGMIVISLSGKSSVGQIGMYVNLCLYTIYLFLFDVKAVIYCIIYSAFNSIACDRLHTQNITAQIMVISSLKDTTAMEVEIMGRLNRGITRIRAEGAFTNEERIVLLIMVSKYEVNRLRGLIRRHDPRAFIVVNEGVNVDGHFIKKLT